MYSGLQVAQGFAILVWLQVFCSSEAFVEGRSKRVIYGLILSERLLHGYDAVRYYVWIGFAREGFRGARPLTKVPDSSREWRSDRLACGGALLTPDIIQTACHCFADFQLPEKDGYKWAKTFQLSTEVVVGSNVVIRNAFTMIRLNKYHLHPLCRKVAGRWISHDFSLARLEKTVAPNEGVTFAPVYPIADMASMWVRFSSRQTVCLMMGFGAWIARQVKTPSWVLRHGWMAVGAYKTCYRKTKNVTNLETFLKDATWTCLRPFRDTIGGTGDSGSPITCDNKYFAVHSQEGTIVADLVFYGYANSMEWRKAMIDDMHHSEEINVAIPFQPEFAVHPDYEPPNFFAIRKSGDIVVTSSFVLLSIAIALHSRFVLIK